ncbi:unnamed protein product [Mucor fragilis]
MLTDIANRELTSQASATAANQDRLLPVKRKISGKRPDQIYIYNNFELGFAESKKSGGETDTKCLADSSFKAPKLLLEMLSSIIKERPAISDELCSVAFVTNASSIKLLLLDSPSDNVFRLQRTESYSFPSQFESFNDVKPILILVWTAKLIMEKTVDSLIAPKALKKVSLKRSAAASAANPSSPKKAAIINTNHSQ